MQKGCLFLLLVLFGLTGFYYHFFAETTLEGKWWVALLLALGVAITLANLYGIILAVKQKIASGKEQRDWGEGDYVAVSGRIQALREPIHAPISGEQAVIVEYDIKRIIGSGDSKNKVSDFSGMMMTPCALQTRRGSVKLVGFPLLAQIGAKLFDDDKDYQRAAEYIAATTFKDRPANPLKLIGELNAVLADDDGDVKLDLKDKRANIFPEEEDQELEEKVAEERVDVETVQTPSELSLVPEGEARVNYIKQQLIEQVYYLEETSILQGAEVTLFGTYRKSKQAIDVGSGLKNLKHSLQLGPLGNVLRKNFMRSLIATVIFGAITVAGHMYVAKMLKFL